MNYDIMSASESTCHMIDERRNAIVSRFAHDIMNSPIGELLICEENGYITQIRFFHPEDNCDLKKSERKRTPLIEKCMLQLTEYFEGKRIEFDLPLNPSGTEFQKKDWAALQKIPYGQTCSYKDIAIAIGNEKACRAVGMANHNNPISIVIPCHRVVGADGSLTGYGGGLHIKKYLLELEQKYNK